MTAFEEFLQVIRRFGLLMDANILTLLVVGSVNPDRIAGFKRTRRYKKSDYELLQLVLTAATKIYTVPHVLAEVNNLTEMDGHELASARVVLKHVIHTIDDLAVASRTAADDRLYPRLGLNDAAIAVAAEAEKCGVLTDDLHLYVGLLEREIPAVNFSHVRDHSWTR